MFYKVRMMQFEEQAGGGKFAGTGASGQTTVTTRT